MRVLIIACSFICLLGCSKIKNKAVETAGDVGEVVGETGSEFVKGVSDGTGITLDCKLELSEDIKNMNLFNGHFDANIMGIEVYAIFQQELSDSFKVVLKNQDGLEYARSKMYIDGKTDEGKNISVSFDEHIKKGTTIYIDKY